MVTKKSKLYSFLWTRSLKLRGRLDVCEFKQYVLVLLFVKYASDRFADVPDAPIAIPRGAGFRDLVALKGHPEIGRRINEKILAPLAAANDLAELPDFNDAAKLGAGSEMVDRLSELISIFESKLLDFSTLRPEQDEDPLGSAYEHLMRYFAPDRSRPQVQPYAPAEVSRMIAHAIGIGDSAVGIATAYDPICGFGSPLVRLNAISKGRLDLYAQAGDAPSSGLTRMHLRLHDSHLQSFAVGNPFADPQFRDGDKLQTFDFVVANPPLRNDSWCGGTDPLLDRFKRFQSFGAPPERRSSYAYLLHVVQSLNATGRGVCVVPQRALSRGSRGAAEAEIRWALVRKGLISGIVGLPPNLFYGTSMAMCLVIVDRREAYARKGIFMIDAGRGFVKDGFKNRLRDSDVRKFAEVFQARAERPYYSRMVSRREIAEADFNLNILHYIGRRRSALATEAKSL